MPWSKTLWEHMGDTFQAMTAKPWEGNDNLWSTTLIKYYSIVFQLTYFEFQISSANLHLLEWKRGRKAFFCQVHKWLRQMGEKESSIFTWIDTPKFMCQRFWRFSPNLCYKLWTLCTLLITSGWHYVPMVEKLKRQEKKTNQPTTHQFDYLCGLSLENRLGNLGHSHCCVPHQSDSDQDYIPFLCWRPGYCWFPKGGFCQLTPFLLAHCQERVWSSANTKRRVEVGWM